MSQRQPDDWRYLNGTPPGTGILKQEPADFVVTEQLGFTPEPDAAGQHHWLYMRKTGWNTHDVITELARFAGVRPNDVGYSGLKDRHAVTEQWFSVQLPALTQPDWSAFQHPGLAILAHVRSHRKLKTGTHQRNHFQIRLRQLTEPDAVAQRVAWLLRGVPNYFGSQRFGRNHYNIQLAERLVAGEAIRKRKLRGLVFSAMRSWLFNHWVECRLEQCGTQPLAGDVFQLAGSRSVFTAAPDDTIEGRLASGDIAITGPLPGTGEPLAESAALALEQQALRPWATWVEALEQAGLKTARRPLLLVPKELTWDQQGNDLNLAFSLPAGAYATTVLRELTRLEEPTDRK